jgi:hypothetical protein
LFCAWFKLTPYPRSRGIPETLTSATIKPVRSLTRDVILRALNLLAEQLPAGRPSVDLVVVGGAAMVLLFGARDSTKDVDAFSVEPEGQARVSEAARRVAAALELPDDWLNDAAKGYAHGLAPGPTLLNTPTLRVRTVSAEQLLAMKLSAWRDDLDVADARRLLRECGEVREEVWRQVERHIVPGRELKTRYAFDDLWESQHGTA